MIDHFDFALCQLDLSKAKGWCVSQEREKARGRVTIRTVVTTTNLEWMDREIRDRWLNIASLSVVATDTTGTSAGKGRKCERRYYIGSRTDDADKVRQAVRLHWSIENQCHWVLDTAFREDHNQTSTGNAAKNLGAVRRIALNILNDDAGSIKNLPGKRFESLMNPACRERLLSLT